MFKTPLSIRTPIMRFALLLGVMSGFVCFEAGLAAVPRWQAEQQQASQSKGDQPEDKQPQVEAKEPEPADGISFTNPTTNRWRIGAKMLGGNRSVKNLLVTIPVPTEWPEQQVKLHSENFPIEVHSADYRDLNSGVRQLVLRIPKLKAKQLIHIDVTFDVTTHAISPPADTSQFKIPKRLPKDIKQYVGVSPQINYRNSKIRKQVKELIVDKESAWSKVEAIFDWVRDNIDYRADDPADTISVYRKRSGCSEDLVGLFVAMCRAAKVPARMVWVEGAQYAEFYLVDDSQTGHWFPCQVAGRREFGSNAEPRIIQQKGDSIRVPEKKERQKFCAEFMSGSGTVKPVVKFVRDLLPAD